MENCYLVSTFHFNWCTRLRLNTRNETLILELINFIKQWVFVFSDPGFD